MKFFFQIGNIISLTRIELSTLLCYDKSEHKNGKYIFLYSYHSYSLMKGD